MAAPDAVRGKNVHAAAIGVRPRSVNLAMRSGMTRQSRMTCSRRRRGKMQAAMPVAEEAQAPVVVHPARAAHVVVRVKVTLAAVVAMQADKVSRAAAIVLPDLTIRRVALSQTR
jgi:hypothetical protein